MYGGGNSEFQLYDDTPENSYVRNNTLFIKPTFLADRHSDHFLRNGRLKISNDRCTQREVPGDQWQNGCDVSAEPGVTILPPIVSAKLTTKKTFSMKYGKVSFKAKMPSGDWLWPAVWLLPKDDVYGGWPRSGEIDILGKPSQKK